MVMNLLFRAMRKTVRTRDPYAKEILRSVNLYVRACFRAESPPHVGELAQQLGLSRSTVSRVFSAATGITLSEYFRARQLECAQRLLRTGMNINKVAHRSGFGTRRTLYRVFKKATGMTPDAYRSRAGITRA